MSPHIAAARRKWHLIREMVLCAGGLGIMLHQTVFASHAQTILILAAMAMLGVGSSQFIDRLMQGLGPGSDSRKESDSK